MVLALAAGSATAAEIYTNLPPVEVTAERLEYSSANHKGWDSGSLLERVPLVTLRQQGIDGSSGDISVRGGAFNSSGILLQGIALRNPQTEHLQGDLAIPTDYLRPLTVVTGGERLLRSSSHAAGAVALELAPLERGGQLSLEAGQAGSYGARWHQSVSPLAAVPELGLSLFAGYNRTDRTDRHRDNDLESHTLGGRLEMVVDDGAYDLLWLTSRRDFGARGFYGTPIELPSAELVRQTLVTGSYRRGARDDGDYDRLALAFQRVDDSYWYSGKSAAITSRHRSEIATLNSEQSRAIDDNWSLAWRGEAGLERLRSATLGDHSRLRSSLALLPTWNNESWRWRVGGAWELFEGDSPAWLPAASVVYKLPDQQQLFLDYSEAIRLPSYTEYNYNNPTSLGNQGLRRQRTRLLEGGWRKRTELDSIELTLFAELNRDSVDWLIIEEGGGQFEATNLRRLRRSGVAGVWSRRVVNGLEARLAGLVQRSSTSQSYYASRYLLDSVRADVKADLIWRITRTYRIDLWQQWQRMPSNPLRGSSRNHWLTGLELVWSSQGDLAIRLALGVANLLNDDFEPFIGQTEAERRAYLRAELAF